MITLPKKGICAHRGGMATYPENTLAAFREAVALGAQMIEFDVRKSKDGHFFTSHEFKNENIPTLEEILNIMPVNIWLLAHLWQGIWKWLRKLRV
ncbi:MAG: glycerophosphodiester phosphodiesterase [Verrucomicrobia bacterium]|nr:glycerophosphodiester phosphodiesterase [Verrucomicrobiota bacterium]MCG2681411.1 glycerophosphodiester phosphodiesterase [Kiritimatiellia bacterium]MBU4248311.1 glycerophosphodiester phosphodiesterase [Verrucomicrobiota bacterium]MBU4289838.1 glycerophosphodiester phosphodiesterase [Verrucomicrobiota bacterium]MBU4429503.1 glycerophosphodiester phosphodiesterase [Verrucomicrobiota bacterium]